MKLNYYSYFNATKNTKTGPVQSPKCAEVSAVGLGVGWACIWDGINLFHYRYSNTTKNHTKRRGRRDGAGGGVGHALGLLPKCACLRGDWACLGWNVLQYQ